MHRPELREDVVDRASVLAAAKTTDSVAGKELDRTGFALRVVRAYVAHGKLIGYMEIGQEIDDFLSRMKAETGDEFGLVVDVAVAVVALLFATVEVLVVRRLVHMSKAMEDVSMRLAGGDHDVGTSFQPSRNDEFGKFEVFLGEFLGVIGTTLRELEKRVRRGA